MTDSENIDAWRAAVIEALCDGDERGAPNDRLRYDYLVEDYVDNNNE